MKIISNYDFEEAFKIAEIKNNIWYNKYFINLIYRTYFKILDLIRYDTWWFPRNIWRYKSFLWTNREWSGEYYYKILKLKIETQLNQFDNWMHYEGEEKTVENMKRCIVLLNNLIQDDYMLQCDKDYEKCEELRNKDKRELFDILYNEIDCWWD
jgi:hypothetical protein